MILKSHSFFIFFLFITFSFFFCSCILILLIFRNEIIHIWFSFSEFHLVHTFTSVPMEESFSSEHSCKLFSYSFKHFLNSSRVSNESYWHFKSFWWDITNWRFYIIWNPFNEIRRIFILYVEHLFINFFGGHSSSKHSGGS